MLVLRPEVTARELASWAALLKAPVKFEPTRTTKAKLEPAAVEAASRLTVSLAGLAVTQVVKLFLELVDSTVATPLEKAVKAPPTAPVV